MCILEAGMVRRWKNVSGSLRSISNAVRSNFLRRALCMTQRNRAPYMRLQFASPEEKASGPDRRRTDALSPEYLTCNGVRLLEIEGQSTVLLKQSTWRVERWLCQEEEKCAGDQSPGVYDVTSVTSCHT